MTARFDKSRHSRDQRGKFSAHVGTPQQGSLTCDEPADGDDLVSRAASGDWDGRRSAVVSAAAQGRAYLLPAGARDNDTARILIDDVDVGQASTLGHHVREATDQPRSTFGRCRLVPDTRVPEPAVPKRADDGSQHFTPAGARGEQPPTIAGRLAKLHVGDPVRLTQDGKTLDLTVQERLHRIGGAGSSDHATVKVGYGPGRWNRDISAAQVSGGYVEIALPGKELTRAARLSHRNATVVLNSSAGKYEGKPYVVGDYYLDPDGEVIYTLWEPGDDNRQGRMLGCTADMFEVREPTA